MRVETTDQLSDDQVAAVLALIDTVTATDGARPLNDAGMLRLRHPVAGSRHLLLWDDDRIAGYAHVDISRGSDAEVELALAPVATDGGGGRELLDEVRRAARGPVQLWAHGSRSAVLGLAEAAGFRSDRVLLQLRRPLPPTAGALPLDEPVWPDGVTVRTFVPGQDEAAWLEVNNRAFADHPDQSDWTVEDVTDREAESWFDPQGFFLAERDGRVVGFHWTKVHPATGSEPALGEVYVVGVDPSMQGQRLGPALTLQGLRHLQAAGLGTAMLYVDESNQVAVRLYERLGFTLHDRDVRLRG